MKTLKIYAIAIILFASLGVAAQTQTDLESYYSPKFHEKVEQWKAAYNSGDAQNLVPLNAENAIYSSSHVTGLEAIGRDKLITYFQNGISLGGHIDEIEILRIEVSADLASLYCSYHATNAGETFTGRNLLVLRKTNSKWFIIFHMTVV